jgi:hypothetical protein
MPHPKLDSSVISIHVRKQAGSVERMAGSASHDAPPRLRSADVAQAVQAFSAYIRSWGWQPRGWFAGVTNAASEDRRFSRQQQNPRRMSVDLADETLAMQVLNELLAIGVQPAPSVKQPIVGARSVSVYGFPYN